jgi:hypothetical protein
MIATTKKLPSLEEIYESEAKVGMVFACHDMEGLKKFKERRKAEIAKQKAAQNLANK